MIQPKIIFFHELDKGLNFEPTGKISKFEPKGKISDKDAIVYHTFEATKSYKPAQRIAHAIMGFAKTFFVLYYGLKEVMNHFQIAFRGKQIIHRNVSLGSLSEDEEKKAARKTFGTLYEFSLYSKTILSEREIVLDYIASLKTLHPWAVRYKQLENLYIKLPRELKNDQELALQIIALNPSCFDHLVDTLKNDANFVKEAVRRNYEILKYAKNFQNSQEVVLIAISQFAFALQFAHEDLRNDYAVCSAAVNKDGKALFWASYNMRGNRHIVEMAIKNDAAAFQYAIPKLQRDDDLKNLAKKAEDAEIDVRRARRQEQRRQILGGI